MEEQQRVGSGQGSDAAPGAGATALDRIEGASGTRPVYVVANREGPGLAAARWRFHRFTFSIRGLDQLILGYRVAGNASVVRANAAGSLRRRPVLGAVSLVNPSAFSEWSIDGDCEVMHVYIQRPALAEFSRRTFGSDLTQSIKEFVGVRDPWLGAYFQMLASEIEYAGGGQAADPLFLAETESILLRHLIEWHRDAQRKDLDAAEGGRHTQPLRSAVLRRVKEYVDVHLAGEIHLGIWPRSRACRTITSCARSARRAAPRRTST